MRINIKSISSITCLIALITSGVYSKAWSQTTQVTVSGIRSAQGKLVLSVFKDQRAYEEEKPFKKIEFDKKALSQGTIALNCQLDPGIYGITLVDDENQNGKIDKNFIGMPKEGFGFSDFYMSKLKKPSFDEFKTEVKSSGAKVAIKVKYM